MTQSHSDTNDTNEQQPSSLIDLQKTKQNMLNGLKRFREFVEQLQMPATEIALIDEMIDRIETHRFTVAVVGEFKRGKSTFVNALLGEEVLPADVLPTTATLNRVTFDDIRPRVELVYQGETHSSGRREEIDLRELSAYVTKLTSESSQRAAQIVEAIIYYNNKYLRKHVDIIDTPGLNDDNAMAAVTMGVLPSVDAVILMTIPASPFSGSEGDFLDKLMLSDMGRVLFVVNQIDSIDPADRQRLLDTIKERIGTSIRRKAEERFGTGPETADERDLFIKRIGDPTVFGISAVDALEAKTTSPRNEELLAASAFEAFEERLEHFLTYDRGIVTLQALASRVIVTGHKINSVLTQEISAAALSQEEFEQAAQTASDEIEDLRRQLQAELARIDKTVELTCQKVRAILARLGDEIAQAASKAIDSAQISPAEIKKERQSVLLQRLSREVALATEVASRAVAERAQFVIQAEYEQIAKQMSEFATALERNLYALDLRFTRPISEDSSTLGVKGRVVEGITVGGVAVSGFFGTSFALSPFIAIIGASPVGLIALGAMAIFGAVGLIAGRQVSSTLFAHDRVESFRKTYRDSVLAQLEQQIKGQQSEIERQFDEHVHDTFARFRRDVQQELGSMLDQRRDHIEDLHARRTRHEALTEVRLEEYHRMRDEVARLVGKAHGLSSQLTDITEV